MKKLRDIILSIFITGGILNLLVNDTNFKKPEEEIYKEIEQQIAAYFFYKNAMFRTQKIIGYNLGNEVGYDVNGDTTYYLMDTNNDRIPDMIRIYIKKDKISEYEIIN